MEFFLPARFLSFSRAAVCTCVSRWPLRWLPTSGLGPAVAANASWAMPRSGPPCPSPFGGSLQSRRLLCVPCACHRVAFFRSHSDQQQHSLSQNKHNTPTKTTPSQASCCVSFSLHRHNALPLALGLLNFQWNAPVSTQLHLLHEEGARRTSLDQFRPLLNTNQISPVYDKLGLNLVCLMGSPPPPRARQRAPPRQLPCSVTREARRVGGRAEGGCRGCRV